MSSLSMFVKPRFDEAMIASFKRGERSTRSRSRAHDFFKWADLSFNFIHFTIGAVLLESYDELSARIEIKQLQPHLPSRRNPVATDRGNIFL